MMPYRSVRPCTDVPGDTQRGCETPARPAAGQTQPPPPDPHRSVCEPVKICMTPGRVMQPFLGGRELLAIRARTARASNGQHQSLRQTEADRGALLREVDRLQKELALHADCRRDISIGDALRLTADAQGES